MKYENIGKYKRLEEVLDAKLPGPLTKMTEQEYNVLYKNGYRKVRDLIPPYKYYGLVMRRISNRLISDEVVEQINYITTTHFYNLLLKKVNEQDKKIKQIEKEIKRKKIVIRNYNKEVDRMIHT